MPVGPYETFEQCVIGIREQGYSTNAAHRICGSMESSWAYVGARRDGADLVVMLYGDIEEGMANQLGAYLEDGVEKVTLRVNSRGGSFHEAVAMHSLLSNFSGTVEAIIDAAAISAATIPIMAASKISIAPGGSIMIHAPSTMAEGSADDLRKIAEMLDVSAESLAAIYARRTGIEASELIEMLKKTTWMDAARAKELAFVDEIVEPQKLAALCVAEFVALGGELDSQDERNDDMAENENPAVPTMAEYKKAFPKADAEFLVECAEKSLSIIDATSAWCARLEASLQAKDEEISTVRNELKEATNKPDEGKGKTPPGGGAKPVNVDATQPAEDVKAKWTQAIEAKMAATGCSRAAAVRIVCKEQEPLRTEYVQAAN